jgi:predicted metalloprotease
MRWRGRRKSENVEDRRGQVPRGVGVGGIGLLVILGIVLLTGGDPTPLLEQMVQQPGGQSRPPTEAENELLDFVSVVLADTEDVWHAEFRRRGLTYREPKLVVFSGAVSSACGRAGASVGPFYCAGDETVYIDLSFYEELRRRFGARGDFAQAYVVAHEIGHHVQKLLGTMERVHAAQKRADRSTANRLSVRLELQADYYAGMWAHHAQRTKDILEDGDLEEAINAAEKIGDDAIQRKTQGHVVPDAFTHGTSAQRAAWFRHGWRQGTVEGGDTFDEANFRRIDPVGR